MVYVIRESRLGNQDVFRRSVFEKIDCRRVFTWHPFSEPSHSQQSSSNRIFVTVLKRPHISDIPMKWILCTIVVCVYLRATHIRGASLPIRLNECKPSYDLRLQGKKHTNYHYAFMCLFIMILCTLHRSLVLIYLHYGRIEFNTYLL